MWLQLVLDQSMVMTFCRPLVYLNCPDELPPIIQKQECIRAGG